MNSSFANQSRRIVQFAHSLNADERDYFPVWGTCQGSDQHMPVLSYCVELLC